jgi:hypothetical protein
VDHALSTDAVAGLLVLLVTVLVVDQVVSSRQLNDRARAVAAQAAIMVTQAARSARAVSSAPIPAPRITARAMTCSQSAVSRLTHRATFAQHTPWGILAKVGLPLHAGMGTTRRCDDLLATERCQPARPTAGPASRLASMAGAAVLGRDVGEGLAHMLAAAGPGDLATAVADGRAAHQGCS